VNAQMRSVVHVANARGAPYVIRMSWLTCTQDRITLQRARSIHEEYENRYVARLGRRGRDRLLALLNKVMEVG
jgi:hypothetical protein